MPDQFSALTAKAIAEPKQAGNRMLELAEYVAQILGLPKDQVRAHEVSKPENLKVRAIPRTGDNVVVAVITGGDVDRTLEEAADLVLDGRFKTIALAAAPTGDEWRIVNVVSSDRGMAAKFTAHWKNASARAIQSKAIPSAVRAWLINWSEAKSKWRNVEGHGYHYGSTLPNAKQVKAGDAFVLCRTGLPGGSTAAKIFAIARVGDVRTDDSGEDTWALFDRYLALTVPASFDEVGGDPRTNMNSIWPWSLDRVRQLLEREGLASIEDAPLVEPVPLPEEGQSPQAEAEPTPQLEVGCFEGFPKRTFEWLAELDANNNEEWYEPRRDEWKELVRDPMRCFVQALAPAAASLGPLETKRAKVMARQRHQFLPKDGRPYNRHYWAAFYRSAVDKKHNDVQLDVSVGPNGFHHGLYFGEGPGGIELRNRLRDLLKTRGEEVLAFVRQLELKDFTFVGPQVDPDEDGYKSFNVVDLQSLRAWAAQQYPRMAHFHQGDDELLRDPAALLAHVAAGIRKLYPLFVLLTTEGDPLVEAAKALAGVAAGGEAEEEEDTELGWDALIAATCLDENLLRQIERALKTKRQVVLYGPPGTGKTWVGRHVAEYFAASPDRVELVQFHPSYGYEDFIEGIRARVVEVEKGKRELDYRVEDGVFKIFCARAGRPENLTKKYVLIIDEINRGNVARILGELLFLLEYRDAEAKLAYSHETFKIPENVYVLATMNTADRSIALVDFALRRRFAFVALAPDPAVLLRWLKAHEAVFADLTVELYQRVNADIDQPDYKIGHSHFMKRHDATSLRDLWDLELEPYLREYFFATPDRLKAIVADVKKILDQADAAEAAGAG